MVAPGTGRRRWQTVDHRVVEALGLMALELFLQGGLRGFALREEYESGRIPVDAMDDIRTAPATPAQVVLQILEYRSGGVPAIQRQRDSQQTCRLVQHDHRVIFIDDRQVAILADRWLPFRAARPVHP